MWQMIQYDNVNNSFGVQSDNPIFDAIKFSSSFGILWIFIAIESVQVYIHRILYAFTINWILCCCINFSFFSLSQLIFGFELRYTVKMCFCTMTQCQQRNRIEFRILCIFRAREKEKEMKKTTNKIVWNRFTAVHAINSINKIFLTTQLQCDTFVYLVACISSFPFSFNYYYYYLYTK